MIFDIRRWGIEGKQLIKNMHCAGIPYNVDFSGDDDWLEFNYRYISSLCVVNITF